MAPKQTDEVVVPSGAAGTVAAAAQAAAEAFAPKEIEKQAQAIVEALLARLQVRTQVYVKRAMKLAAEKPQIAEPTGPVYPLYPYWDVLLYGPFQPLGGPGGPFLPHKIIQAGEPAFMGVVLWRNPACINWACPAPSAATLMAAYQFQTRLETINLTNVTDGPDFAFPAPPTPPPFFGAGFLNSGIVWISGPLAVPAPLPAPPQGKPDLYEMNLTVDIVGPVPLLPFAGFSTWVWDPDFDPPFFGLPGVTPGWQYDIPARFMVYTA